MPETEFPRDALVQCLSELERRCAIKIGRSPSISRTLHGIDGDNYFVDADGDLYVLTVHRSCPDQQFIPPPANICKLLPYLARRGLKVQEVCGYLEPSPLGVPISLSKMIPGHHTTFDYSTTEHLKSMALFLASQHNETKLPAHYPIYNFAEEARMRMQVSKSIIQQISCNESPKKNPAEVLSAALIENGCEQKIATQFAIAVFEGHLFERLENVYSTIEARMNKMFSRQNSKYHYSLCHADPNFTNVLFKNDTAELAGVIDYWRSQKSLSAYDFANMLMVWAGSRDINCASGSVIGEKDGLLQLNCDRISTLTTTYNSIRPLSEYEIDALPELMVLAALLRATKRINRVLAYLDPTKQTELKDIKCPYQAVLEVEKMAKMVKSQEFLKSIKHSGIQNAVEKIYQPHEASISVLQ